MIGVLFAAVAVVWASLEVLHARGTLGHSVVARQFGRFHFWPAVVLARVLHFLLAEPGWLLAMPARLLLQQQPSVSGAASSLAHGPASGHAGLFSFWQNRRWFNQMCPGVFLGSFPFVSTVEELHQLGVRAVVNLLDEHAGPTEAYTKLGWKNLYLPTLDHMEPDIADLVRGVEFVASCRAGSSPAGVFVHCKAGHGRSAALVFCYLYVFEDLESTGTMMSHTSADIDEDRLQLVQRHMNQIRHVRTKLWRQENVRKACQILIERNFLSGPQ